MAKYFEKFPKVLYDINNDGVTKLDQPVNIMVRVGVVSEVLRNIFFYYEYSIKEEETPEILAEKYYGDPELHWLVLMTNQILDPQYDWPLNYRDFQNYLVSRYGSLANAETTYQYWAKVIKTTDSYTGIETTQEIQMTESDYDDSALPTSEPLGETYTVGAYTVRLKEYKTRVLVADYERALNENRRNIKLIKPEYVPQIQMLLNSILLEAGAEKLSIFERVL